MVAGAEVLHQTIPVLDVQYRCIAKGIEEMVEAVNSTPASPPAVVYRQAAKGTDAVSVEDIRSSDAAPNVTVEPAMLQFVPTIRSGSFADIGLRRYMEDEHICIDDLVAYLGSSFRCPEPSAFYAVFDGHGGPDAATYLRKHAMRFFFEVAGFPQESDTNDTFIRDVENSLRNAFLLADVALADDCTVSSSSGTTALTALIVGRLLLVANAGDCRAVLCRKGQAVDMSQDHRPNFPAERQRVEECGGYVEDGYLNGVLSLTRALGDWDIKLPRGSPSPLIAEPEFKRTMLTEDDEFLIIGCDGIWDVMSSQQAVGIVRRGLRRHDDPEQCARDVVMEALRLKTIDNLTVVVVCFSSESQDPSPTYPRAGDSHQGPKLRCCNLSAEALCNLRSWLE